MKIRITFLIAIIFCVALLASAQTSKETTVFGQKIHYVEAGSGPTVILLHGLGGSSEVWQFNLTALAEKYHVVVPDQIGFGKSDKPLVNYRIRTYVDFLDQFCKQLKIERASLVGNSMGGWIATAFTAAFPDRVDKLVLVDAAGYAPPKDIDTRTFYALNPTTREGTRVLLGKVFYNKLFQTDAAVEQAIASRLAAGDGYTVVLRQAVDDEMAVGADRVHAGADGEQRAVGFGEVFAEHRAEVGLGFLVVVLAQDRCAGVARQVLLGEVDGAAPVVAVHRQHREILQAAVLHRMLQHDGGPGLVGRVVAVGPLEAAYAGLVGDDGVGGSGVEQQHA